MRYIKFSVVLILSIVIFLASCKKWSFNKIKGTYSGTWVSHSENAGNVIDTTFYGDVNVSGYDNKEKTFTIISDEFLYEKSREYKYNKSGEYTYEKQDRVVTYNQKVSFKPQGDSIIVTINYTIRGGGPQSIIKRTFNGKRK